MTGRRELVAWSVGLLVVALLWLAVALRPPEPVPCVDFVPENVGCAAPLSPRP